MKHDLRDQTIPEQNHKSSKRKRDELSVQNLVNSSMKSISQLSISQEVAWKKVKHSTSETGSSTREMNNEKDPQQITMYKPSKYLKMPRKLLLNSLHLQLNYPLKKTKEQRFILARLKIIDQQFCLEQLRHLYQTYLDLGLQHQVWPVSYIITLPLSSLHAALFQE